MLVTRSTLVLFLGLGPALAACGGSEAYRLPVDSAVKPFAAPDREDLIDADDQAEAARTPAAASPAAAPPAETKGAPPANK